MNCIELSIESLENKCRKWAEEIKAEYRPDLMIYVAKAGYLVARPMIGVFDAPIIGIEASREGNGLKSLLGPVISRLPSFVRNTLISIELKTGIHNKKSERKVEFHKGKENIDPKAVSRILVLDDSVDTGHTMRRVVDIIKEEFPAAEVRIAAMNVWDKSEEIIKTDYALFKNVIIKAPMSKDSREYSQFIHIYDEDTRNGYI